MGDRLAALETALAERPEAPTLVFLHHPPFDCGIRHMDRIALSEGRDELARIITANRQVERVLCGHHHRPIQIRFAGTIAQIAPSVAHQVTLDLTPDDPGSMIMEPPAFLLHLWHKEALITHQAYVEAAPGPFPFVLDADYPGGDRNNGQEETAAATPEKFRPQSRPSAITSIKTI
ncbi:MAG: hypothetical protein Q8O82_01955 [Pseudorhodobacter sp.]|nr:hypothetical protein [Pseudorhodobacter sp.]